MISAPVEIADSLNTYFQSVFGKEKYVDGGQHFHFSSRNCTSNDDGKALFT